MQDKLSALGQTIADAVAGSVIGHTVATGELTVTVKAQDIIKVMRFLRDDPQCRFEQLIDVIGVDWPERAKRFDVVYLLLSLRLNHRVRVKLQTD